MLEIETRLIKSLYRKSLYSLKRGSGFYHSVNAAINKEAASFQCENTRMRINNERGLLITSLGMLFMRRHPRLVV